MLEIADTLLQYDYSLLIFLNTLFAESRHLRSLALIINSVGDFVVACAIVAMWFSVKHGSVNYRHGRVAVLLMLLSLLPAYASARLLQHVVTRPRPIVAVELTPALNAPLWEETKVTFSHWGSLPSDHSVLMTITGITLFGLSRRVAMCFTLFCLLFFCCRIATGYHWPSDMVAGVGIGAAVSALMLASRSIVEKLLARVVILFDRFPPLLYCMGFSFLVDLSSGFYYTQMIVRQAFHVRLFH